MRPLALLLLLVPALAGAQQTPADTVQPADTAYRGAPVVVRGDTVLRVFGRVGSFTPEERAAALTERLRRLAADPGFVADSIRVEPGADWIDIVHRDVVLLTITDADAVAAGTDREALALGYAARLRAQMRELGWWERVRIIATGGFLALLTALVAYGAFRLVQGVFPRVIAFLERGRGTWIPTLRLQRQEILTGSRITDALIWLTKAARVLVLVVLLYVAVPTILSFFPWTRGLSDRLFDYILTPFARLGAAFLEFVPNLFTIGAISLVTWYLLKLIHLFFEGIRRGNIRFANFYEDWAEPTYKIVRFLVLVFAFIAVWPYLPGSDSSAFRGVGVLLGLLISFGSAAAIGNVIGGIVLTYMRPFRVGDRVRIADTEGDVIERTLLVTRVRTNKNVDVTIPNAMVLASHIVNYSSSASRTGLILHTQVTIGYDAPWRKVHELLVQAARDTADIRPEPAPFVLQRSLDDFYVTYELNAYTAVPGSMAAIYSELHQNIQDRFHRAGVEIMSPHFEAQRDGLSPAIPPDSG